MCLSLAFSAFCSCLRAVSGCHWLLTQWQRRLMVPVVTVGQEVICEQIRKLSAAK